MATEKIKVYEEEKKKGFPLWWILPLLLLLALAGWALTRNRGADATAAATTQGAATAFPDLGTVHFDTDKATLTADGQATLGRAADFMKTHPKSHLRLEGYTDSTGNTGHNDVLSQQRAASVEQYLMAAGIPKDRLTGQGFGEEKPVASNATTQGKADNRRVELFEQ